MTTIVKHLNKHGLQTLANKVKSLVTSAYVAQGRAIYADDTYLADPNKEQDIDSAGLWKQTPSGWTKVETFAIGAVYDVINQFTTTSDFVEGAGKVVSAGTNVVVANVGTATDPVLKFDVFASSVDLAAYQTKVLVETLSMFANELSTVYTDPATLPSSEAVASATITDGTIAVLSNNDVYRASVSVNQSDDTLNDITWTKLGNQGTVDGALALIASCMSQCPDTPISDAEIDAMFV